MADQTKPCPACGEQILAVAKKCKHCGEILDATYQTGDSQRHAVPAAPIRTESIVVQIAPDLENEKIKEMETFGWTLAGRQEVERSGDTKGEVTTNIWGEGVYREVKNVTRYVKLHFQRPSNLTNLEEVKQLEADYFALPWRSASTSGYVAGGCLALLGACPLTGAIVGLSSGGMRLDSSTAVPAVVAVVAGAFLLGGIAVLNATGKKAKVVAAENVKLGARAKKILADAASLLQS